MKKATKILLPIDFSESASNAYHYALQFADKIEASIEIINVIFPEGESIDYPVLVAQATQAKIENTRKRLQVFADKSLLTLKSKLKKAPIIDTHIEIGTPIQSICDYAKREQVDLIIMGSRGADRSTLEKWMGSVAKGVVGKAPCPVLVIPEHQNFKSIETMTYATEIKDSDPFEIWRTLDLIRPFKPKINVVHVNLKKDGDLKAWKKLEKMKAFFKEQTPNMNIELFHIPGKDIKVELEDFVEIHATDLLVMYQPHHSFWDRLFFRSNTQEMANYTKVPLLVQKTD